MFPAYNVVAGAMTGSYPRLAELIGEVSAYDLPKFTIDVLRLYLEKKQKYASFSNYITGEGKDDIVKFVNKYKIIPEFYDDKNYYFDWGADNIFSLTAKGVGECSAGLFDMIDVDLNTINKVKEQLENETIPATINNLLYTLVFSSSRMLLITRGAEPKNIEDVFSEFISKFIDAKLISNVFREIVLIARDEMDFNLIQKKDTILDLVHAVITLYENMDDSLQFSNVTTISSEIKNDRNIQTSTRKKDFRGIACPMNFVKTKIELASLPSGELLEIFLDDGEPIENVPGSLIGEGHQILQQKMIDNDYWQLIIKKG
jgi:sulfite reductase (ferredoxin)